jgi:hypothetical protein
MNQRKLSRKPHFLTTNKRGERARGAGSNKNYKLKEGN